MTRKDYRLIADAIGSLRLDAEFGNTSDQVVFDAVVLRLSDRLHQDNPTFKPGVFKAYAGTTKLA